MYCYWRMLFKIVIYELIFFIVTYKSGLSIYFIMLLNLIFWRLFLNFFLTKSKIKRKIIKYYKWNRGIFCMIWVFNFFRNFSWCLVQCAHKRIEQVWEQLKVDIKYLYRCWRVSYQIIHGIAPVILIFDFQNI